MSIWGKLVGGAAGLALGGPLGVLLGVGVGHAVDTALGPGSGQRQVLFTIGLIALSAKMAKADGEVSPPEIEAFYRLVQVPDGELKRVRRTFERAAASSAGYQAYASQLAASFQDNPTLLEDLLDALFVIAAADGMIHPEEQSFLVQVAQIFGFSQPQFDRIAARHLDFGPVAGAYAILGVDPSVPDDELRAAYRRLVRTHHPDRMLAKGVPPDLVRLADLRMADINAAFDLILETRSAMGADTSKSGRRQAGT